MPKCLYCEKEFEISIKGSGLKNRLFCYDCIPMGLTTTDRTKLQDYLFKLIARRDKIKRGCDICGYNKCASALEWHHPNKNKEGDPSSLLKLKGWGAYIEEITKCQLLCSNCHKELHNFSDEYYLEQIDEIQQKGYSSINAITEQMIIDSYKYYQSIHTVAFKFNMDRNTISKILHDNDINIVYKSKKPVYQIDKDTNEIINTFASISDALQSLNKSPSSGGHITKVCRGERHTAYGYKWQYVE